MKNAAARVSGTSLFTKYMLLKEEKYIQEEEKSVYPIKKGRSYIMQLIIMDIYNDVYDIGTSMVHSRNIVNKISLNIIIGMHGFKNGKCVVLG